jgi:hypothetical protein
MIMEYSRCELGKRCIIKTDDSYLFRKFTLLVAISNSKYIGWVLYEKGGMTKERLVEFLDKFIFNKYKNHLIILDNAGSHKNSYVKDAITNSGNKYLFSIPYTPKTNVIEMFFTNPMIYMDVHQCNPSLYLDYMKLTTNSMVYLDILIYHRLLYLDFLKLPSNTMVYLDIFLLVL